MTKEIEWLGEKIYVSDDGTIIWNDKVRNFNYSKDGYPRVCIKTYKGWRNPAVYILIALAFVPNPNNLPEVDHIDFDRTNFKPDNLQWISHEDNVRRSVCNKPDVKGANNPNYGNHKLHEKYAANPDLAKRKQSRPGKQNGRYKDGRSMKV